MAPPTSRPIFPPGGDSAHSDRPLLKHNVMIIIIIGSSVLEARFVHSHSHDTLCVKVVDWSCIFKFASSLASQVTHVFNTLSIIARIDCGRDVPSINWPFGFSVLITPRHVYVSCQCCLVLRIPGWIRYHNPAPWYDIRYQSGCSLTNRYGSPQSVYNQ